MNQFLDDNRIKAILMEENSSEKKVYIQSVLRLVEIIAEGDFLGLYDQTSSYKHVSDFGRLRSYGHFFNFRTRFGVNRVLYGSS